MAPPVTDDKSPDSTILTPSMPLDAELARRVLKAAPIVLYVYDVQQERSIFQNRRFGELLGQPPPTQPQSLSEWKTLVHPDDEMRFPEHRERLRKIQAGETLFREFRMRQADGQWRWFVSRDALLSSDAAGKPLLVVGSASDITEQKNVEQNKELLAGEMRHRAKNLVTLIESIGRLSRPKDQPEVDKFMDAFLGRLRALLNAGDIVLSSASRMADLQAVLKTTLAPFMDEAAPARIKIEGPAIALLERTIGGLSLALHELATNAVKYGALSVPAGSVSVTWTLSAKDRGKLFAMEWKEVGGPRVSPPTSEGFGGRVIRHSITREPNGHIALDYLPDGLRCRFEFEIPAKP
jgi:PAS domain S-box-containing protein